MPIEDRNRAPELTRKEVRQFNIGIATVLGAVILLAVTLNPSPPSPNGIETVVTEPIQDIHMDSWLGDNSYFPRFTIDTDTRTVVVKNIHSPVAQSDKDTVTYTVTDDGEITDAKIALSPESVKTYSEQYADTYEQTLTVEQPEKENAQ